MTISSRARACRRLVGGLILTTALGFAGSAGAQSVTLTFAASGADQGALKAASVYLAEEMEKRTDGRVQVERFMGGALGGEVQLNELLIAGEVDIILAGVFADNNYPEVAIGSIPFLLPSWEEKQRYYDTPEIREKIAEKLEGTGLVFLEPITMGQQYITSNRALQEPADIEGLKLRVAEDQAQIKVYGALGALVTPMSSSQIFSALQTGVIDAQVNTLSNNYGRQVWEVQDYLIRGRHILWPWNLATSEQALAKLSDEDRETLLQVTHEMRDVAAAAVEEQEAPMIAEMTEQHGMDYIEWDPATLERWQEAARPAIEELLAEKDPQVVEIVRELAGW